MGLQCTTTRTLKLATVPLSFSSSSRFIFRPVSKTVTLGLFSRPNASQRPAFTLLARALSAPAVQTITSTEGSDAQVIDFKWIRDNKEAVSANIKIRKSNANLELVLELYEKMSNLQKEVERLREERNAVAKKMKGKSEPSKRQKLIEDGKNLKEVLETLEEDLVKLKDELQQEAQCIPNMAHPDVSIGGKECSTVRKMVLTSQPRIIFSLGKNLISLILMLLQRSVVQNFTTLRMKQLYWRWPSSAGHSQK